MNRRSLIVAAPALTAWLVLAQPASATVVCPDGHLPFPVMDAQDAQKDHNNNGFVCKKVNNQGDPVGGPDDTMDDIV
jgi:hypothetical protein